MRRSDGLRDKRRRCAHSGFTRSTASAARRRRPLRGLWTMCGIFGAVARTRGGGGGGGGARRGGGGGEGGGGGGGGRDAAPPRIDPSHGRGPQTPRAGWRMHRRA